MPMFDPPLFVAVLGLAGFSITAASSLIFYALAKQIEVYPNGQETRTMSWSSPRNTAFIFGAAFMPLYAIGYLILIFTTNPPLIITASGMILMFISIAATATGAIFSMAVLSTMNRISRTAPHRGDTPHEL